MEINATLYAQILHFLLLFLFYLAIPAYLIFYLFKRLSRIEKRLRNIEDTVLDLKRKMNNG